MVTPSKQDYAAVINALRNGRCFVLPLHHLPDGDCIGSALALAEALRYLGKCATVVTHDRLSETFAMIPETKSIVPLTEWDQDADTVIMVDASDIERTGMTRAQLAGKHLVNIDHHVSNEGFGDTRYVDATKASCSEIIYDMLTEMKVPVSKSMAGMLYLGIMTDSGSFRYESTSASTLHTAGHLVSLGADPAHLASIIYGTAGLKSLRILGAALSGIELAHDSKVAWTIVSRALMSEHGATADDAEGIVNYVRMIPGVEVAVSLREESATDEVKVGLRSSGVVDVSRVAAMFGGGGHTRAAGYSFAGATKEALRQLLAVLGPLVMEQR